MSLSICTSCLSRLIISSRASSRSTATILTASFSTSSTQYANPPKKNPSARGMPSVKHREAKSVRIKRKNRERPKPPAVGERKAAKKRIVLSNANALEVSGMEDLSAQNMADNQNIGQFLGLNGPLLDQLREAKVFKPTQNWNMFRKPATLVREETVKLGQQFVEVNDSLKNQGVGAKTLRQIFAGEKASGKSLLLVQAISMAFLNNWIVVNIPEAQDFVINTSSYAPVKGAPNQEQTYTQPHLTSSLLSRIVFANADALGKLRVGQNHSSLNVPIPTKSTLKDLAMMGVNDPTLAWPIWQALWTELTSSGPSRPPVLLTIDGLDHWMGPTKYRSTEYNVIHAHQFLLVRQLIQLLFSSGTQLPNGGLLLGATTGSNVPNVPSFDLLLRQLRARASGLQVADPLFPMPEPYKSVDQRILDLLKGSEKLDVVDLKGLSKSEARGLLEYFARSGIFQEKVTDAVVSEKWSLSGGGVIGEMARFGSRLRVNSS